MTSATARLVLSLAASPLETVAANASTSWKLFTWVARTARSSRISGACAARTALPRRAAALLPTWAAAGWLFKITITCWLTFCESRRASDGVSRPEVGVVVAPTA